MKIRLVSYLSIVVLMLSALAGAQAQDPLPSWNDGATKRDILNFVRETTDPASPSFVLPEQRIANFDQGGNTWAVYQPMRELERYLRANGYKTMTAGQQEPVRVRAEQVYGFPPEQVIGTALSAGPSLMMLVLHDDVQGEYGYGASTQALYDQARGWTVISMKKDWKRRFASQESGPWDPRPPGLWFLPEPVVEASGDVVPTSSRSAPVL